MESRNPGGGLIHETKFTFPKFHDEQAVVSGLFLGTDKRKTVEAPQPQRQQSAVLLVAKLEDLHSPMPSMS